MRFGLLIRTLAAAAAALALTACGDDAGSGTATGAQPDGGQNHNQSDVTFLHDMIPHHAQAIEMTRLIEGRVESEQVRELAGEIEAAQGPEIERMKGLLQDFGADVPSAGMGGMDHGSMGSMQGMMSPAQMQRLEQLSGPEFDTMFLQMMIEHHQGAVTMSDTVLESGQNPEVQELARQIIEVQEAEIATMSALLQQS